MAIKVIAQRREVKLGKNPGKKPLHPHPGKEGVRRGQYPQRYLCRCDQGGLGCRR